MPDPTADAGAASRRWSRRALLGGLAVVTAGCALSDPAVRGPGGRTSPLPTPTPTPFAPGLDRALAAETALAAGARALLADAGATEERRRDLLALLQRTHEERAAALAAADPTARPTAGPDPSPGPRPATATTERLADGERDAARRHRTAALAASGPAALLWGSMAVASSAFGDALEADVAPASATVAEHRPLSRLSDMDAVSALVASLHAVVWGYQLALGRLPVSGAAHDRAAAGLAGRRALQDRLVDQLLRAGVEVPPAAPAYDPDPEVRDADDAALLIRRMETRLLPFCGLWLAAAGRLGDRTLALDTLGSTLRSATTWGAPLPAWPGYPE